MLLFFASLSFSAISQCMIEHYSLEKRVTESDLVVEGRILEGKSYFKKNSHFIYTVYQLELYRVFKGKVSASTIEVITEGGRIDLEMMTAHPSFQVTYGLTGVFFLKNTQVMIEPDMTEKLRYAGMASEQSVITYDLDDQFAYDHDYTYGSIQKELYKAILSITGEDIQIVNPVELDPWKGKIRPLATPVISSFNKDTISAGAEEVLIINGSNFGSTRGKGAVQFLDANYGDGRTFSPEYRTSYISWSDTKIEVMVPSRAGTGRVKVLNNNNETGTSSKNLTISYSHLNTYYASASIDTQYFVTDHVDDNAKGGYTWQMHVAFKARTNAVNSFMRALETWRCGTLMNWDVGTETTVNTISRDNVNLVRMTKFTDNKLGVCYSYWSGCGTSTSILWYVAELDIEFDSTKNWYYGTGTPSGSQMDFESVAVHELGHGHQLGHVIDTKKIMHYSIGNGQRKTTLSTDDVNGANAVMNRSVQSNFCGPNKLIALSPTKCSITKPFANFGSSQSTACPGDNITVTDSSEGVVSTYLWSFGDNANPGSASGIGPHTLAYSTPGTKTIRLITINSFGVDTVEKTIVVNPPAPGNPVPYASEDSVCVGLHTYAIAPVQNATSYLWMLSGGGSISGPNTDTTVNINWIQAGGPHQVRIVALNSCGNSATIDIPVKVYNKAVASFTSSVDARTVTFTNTSTGASSYIWRFGDGDSSVDANPQHTYSHASSYTAVLIAKNFCSESEKTSNVVTMNGAGIGNNAGQNIRVYPNPADNIIFIHLDENWQSADLTLYDITGREVILNYKLTAGKNSLNFDALKSGWYQGKIISNENPGVYFKIFKQ